MSTPPSYPQWLHSEILKAVSAIQGIEKPEVLLKTINYNHNVFVHSTLTLLKQYFIKMRQDKLDELSGAEFEKIKVALFHIDNTIKSFDMEDTSSAEQILNHYCPEFAQATRVVLDPRTKTARYAYQAPSAQPAPVQQPVQVKQPIQQQRYISVPTSVSDDDDDKNVSPGVSIPKQPIQVTTNKGRLSPPATGNFVFLDVTVPDDYQNVMVDEGTCMGMTAKNERCKKKAIDGTSFCSHHTPRA
jgi:hypothetical protein